MDKIDVKRALKWLTTRRVIFKNYTEDGPEL